jgi:tetratricopeptide (TPR) repeat protein
MDRALATPLLPLLVLFLAASGPSARAEWEAGKQAFQQGRYDEAVRELRETVTTHPDYPPGHYMLGLALHKLGRPAEALASLQRATMLAPEEVSYTLSLAQTLIGVKRYGDALETLAGHDLSTLPPALKPTFVVTLAAAGSKAEAGKALPLLRQAVEQDASSPDLWLALGNAAGRSGATTEAFRAYEHSYRLDSANSSVGRKAVSTGLRLARDAGEGKQGRDWYRRAAELGAVIARADPADADRLLPGEAWLNAGDAAAARAWFEECLRSRPRDPEAELGLARALLDLTETAKALTALDRALAASPDGTLAAQIQRRRGYAFHQLEDYGQAARAYRASDTPEKAAEMEKFQAIAGENATIDRRRKECLEKQARVTAIKKEKKDLFPPDEWAGIERDLDLSLAECKPYLDAA